MAEVDDLFKNHTIAPVVETGGDSFDNKVQIEGTIGEEKEVQAVDTEGVKVDPFIDVIESAKKESGLSDEELHNALSEAQSLDKTVEEPKSLDISSIIKEKTSGKYQDLESLLAKLEEADLPKEEVFASEQIKKLNDLAKSGKDIRKVLEFESMGIENIDTSDINQSVNLIKIKLKKEDPEITEREIKMILKSDYGLKSEEDYMDDEEKDLSYIKIKRKAKTIKQELLKEKEEYTLPSTEDFGKRQKEIADQQQKIIDSWKKTVNDNVNSYADETFKITETDEFKFQVKDDTRSTVRGVMSNPDQLWNKYIKTDGTRDMGKLRRDMLLLERQDEIIKSVYAQGLAMGGKKLMDSLKNPSKKSSSAGATKEKPLDMREQILQQSNK